VVWLAPARAAAGEGGNLISTERGHLLGPRYVCGYAIVLGRNAFGRCRWFVTVAWAINKRILVIGVGPSEAGPDQGPIQDPAGATTLPNGASSTTSLMAARVSLMAARVSLMAASASLMAARASLVAAMAARMTPTST
jgi:hypothetical protein